MSGMYNIILQPDCTILQVDTKKISYPKDIEHHLMYDVRLINDYGFKIVIDNGAIVANKDISFEIGNQKQFHLCHKIDGKVVKFVSSLNFNDILLWLDKNGYNTQSA